MARVSKLTQALLKEATKSANKAVKKSGDAEVAREKLLELLDQAHAAKKAGRLSDTAFKKTTEGLWEQWARIPAVGRDRQAENTLGYLGDATDAASPGRLDISTGGVLDEAYEPDYDDVSRYVADQEMAALDRARELTRRVPITGQPGRHGKFAGDIGWQDQNATKATVGLRENPYQVSSSFPEPTGPGGSTAPLAPPVQSSAGMPANVSGIPSDVPMRGMIQNPKGAAVRGETKFRDLRKRRGSGAAAAAGALALSQESQAENLAATEQPGVLSDLAGRVRDARQAITAPASMAIDMAADLGSQALSGLSGLGTLALGGSLEGAVNNIDTVREATTPEVGDMPGMDAIVEAVANHPGAAEKLLAALDYLESMDENAGDAMYNLTGSPAAGAAAKTTVRGALELL